MGQPSGDRRIGGYLPIGDYAAIGDGRSVALVGTDGSVDWLPVPDLDSPPMFGRLLDADRGGSFRLSPVEPWTSRRRYLPDTNVLETTFETANGVATVTDALTLHNGAVLPWTELARRVECVSGLVTLDWHFEPRFAWGHEPEDVCREDQAVIAVHGNISVGLLAFGADRPRANATGARGEIRLHGGQRALLAVIGVAGQPVPLPDRAEIEARIDRTAQTWQTWAEGIRYDGAWSEQVHRSALALKLLITPSGAVAAAPTTSLPEVVGGSRNWDYRYCWVRDSSFTVEAMLRVNLVEESHSALAFLLGAARSTLPRLDPFYELGGGTSGPERHIDFEGYRASVPVRSGNGARDQLQLGCYGDLFGAFGLYVDVGNRLDAGTGELMAGAANAVCDRWRRADAGIWELGEDHRYTFSKIASWVALDRALSLADRDQLPSSSVQHWRREHRAVREMVEQQCWSEDRCTYLMSADEGEDRLDAAVLLAARNRFVAPRGPRLTATIDAVRAELGDGPFLYRYSGMADTEGAFLACSFWLVEALAVAGRLDEAAEVMDGTLAAANDVGLLSEEVDPSSGELLGNIPQGLSHLALVSAASIFTECTETGTPATNKERNDG